MAKKRAFRDFKQVPIATAVQFDKNPLLLEMDTMMMTKK